MSKKIISHEVENSKKLNEHLQGLKNLFGEPLKNLIYYCYDEFDASYEQIGNALGKSRQAVEQQYPKKGKHGR